MMKQYILILGAAISTISLMAFVYITGENYKVTCELSDDQSKSEFLYEINNRFSNTITKGRLLAAKSVRDLIPENNIQFISSFTHTKITLFSENRNEWKAFEGDDEFLTQDQLDILNKLDYGSSFFVTGNIKRFSDESESIADDTLVYYITLIPHASAKYSNGKDELINYLKENSREDITFADTKVLQPGKISFTINTTGNISQVSLESTCGYDSIDKKMVSLIKDIPGSWEIATNSKGEPVPQSQTFFFGIIGC